MIFTLVSLVIVAVCFLIAAAGFAAIRRLPELSGGQINSLVWPFLFPMLIFVWGLMFQWDGPEDAEPAWHLEATRWLFFVLYPSLCAFSIWRARGFRLYAAALIPLSLIGSLFATGIAVAFVTGD